MPEKRHNRVVARTAARVASALRRVWVGLEGNAGGVEVGLILTEVSFTANPWVSVQYVAERLGGAYSTFTVRRRLEEMVDTNHVEVLEFGGRKLYRASEDAAARSVEAVKDCFEALRG